MDIIDVENDSGDEKKAKTVYKYPGTKDGLKTDIDAAVKATDLTSKLNDPLETMLAEVTAMTKDMNKKIAALSVNDDEIDKLNLEFDQLIALECTIDLSDDSSEAAEDDGDDDDVMFVEETYDPNKVVAACGCSLKDKKVKCNKVNCVLYKAPPLPLVVGSKMFGRKRNGIWYKGTLSDILHQDKSPAKRQYRFKFDQKGIKMLEGRHIACSEIPREILAVGTRIIAVYREDEASKARSYFAGITAESPSIKNDHRYLVFFDDGYAQYCTKNEIHRVYEQSKNVWEDIEVDSQPFIKGYLKQYPERPMVRLTKGQLVKTEWNGSWWKALVQEVDASLVKMYFDADKRVEWIYRGSTRLEPLYTELLNAEASRQKGKSHRTALSSTPSGAKRPFVEYTRGNENVKTSTEPTGETQVRKIGPKSFMMQQKKSQEEMQANKAVGINRIPSHLQTGPSLVAQAQMAQKKKAVAKKSTAKPSQHDSVNLGKMVDNERLRSGLKYNASDMASVLSQRLMPDFSEHEYVIKRPREYSFHVVCTASCLHEHSDDPKQYLGQNSLLIPMMGGWERQLSKQKNNGRRSVYYRAPCGRRLKYLDEVDRFLVDTGSQLTIDLFCFDTCVHIYNEFVPIKTFCDIKDLSYGKETVPISCVNGIDRQYPDYVEYSNIRMPMKGVELNLDEDFLVGCDCTDGCRDRSKCQCQQLSVEATEVIYGGKVDPSAGYEHRRLKERHVAGIYECNSRCKCDCRCVNRVVQNGLRLRLQVFKTEHRGWGIRCLDDIPEGGFICIYAGQLLTEQGANEDGQQYGDEYLAELDHIEVLEKYKEDYESDVNTEVTDDEDDQKGQKTYKLEDEDVSDSTYSGERRTKTTRQVKDLKGKELSSRKMTAQWVDKLPEPSGMEGNGSVIVLSDDEDSNPGVSTPGISTPGTPGTPAAADSDTQGRSKGPTSMNTSEDDTEDKNTANKRTTRSQASRFGNLPDPVSQSGGIVSPLKINLQTMKVKEVEKQKKAAAKPDFISIRNLMSEENIYIMDAKSCGNLGRYLNHGCTPNSFVQNVFVDTHDPRFPWIAFFAGKYIRAGTELTWDYNYEVGSVPNKVLHCFCGSVDCRGRLL